MERNISALTAAQRTRLREKKLYLLDMDGTLYLDEQLFPGAAEFLHAIRENGGRYLFLTNNSSRSGEDYVAKMHRLGIPCEREDFLSSVDALCADLHARGMEKKLLYAFGTRSFCAQLRAAGFTLTDDRDASVDALVIGFDTELTFQKLEDACILLGRGVEFIAANPDWVCPTRYGYVPDCGSVCEMLRRATGRTPRVIGKPQPDMALLAMEKYGVPAREAVLIGDRLYTDIACGVNAGIDTVLVLSGEATEEDLAASETKPTFVLQSVADYAALLT